MVGSLPPLQVPIHSLAYIALESEVPMQQRKGKFCIETARVFGAQSLFCGNVSVTTFQGLVPPEWEVWSDFCLFVFLNRRYFKTWGLEKIEQNESLNETMDK